mgnify:CR=1 FL=1
MENRNLLGVEMETTEKGTRVWIRHDVGPCRITPDLARGIAEELIAVAERAEALQTTAATRARKYFGD